MMTYRLEDITDFLKDAAIKSVDATVNFADNAFFGVETVEGQFIYDINSVHETEYPYRACDKALFLRVAPSKALVLGIWKAGNKDVTKHLMDAMKARIIVLQENEAVA